MSTTKIRVVRDGSPVSNVFVLASDINNHWQETDENGEVSTNFDEGTAYAGLVAVKTEDGAVYGIHTIIEDGEEKELTVP